MGQRRRGARGNWGGLEQGLHLRRAEQALRDQLAATHLGRAQEGARLGPDGDDGPLLGERLGGVEEDDLDPVTDVVLLAVAGTLLPIPTGAEVAVVAAMLAVGIPGPLAAALLITLPALSLPSLLMVRNAFPRRLLVAVTGLVVTVGLLTSVGALAVGL